MNIVIIEDELLTAEDLADMIGRWDNTIHIPAMLYSVKEAIDYFRKSPRVDLIFADIQLGDGLSFELFRTLKIEAPVIFCTAYDEYALEAIRSNGIDYVLKPFTADTIARAIEKYNNLRKHFTPPAPHYEALIRQITGKERGQQQVNSILVHHRDKVLPLGFDEIALFYVEGEIVRLHCFNGKNYIIGQTLEQLEEITKGQFFRVNRQYLVNRRAILDANHYPPRKYVVNLSIAFKDTLVVSKNRTTDFLQWLVRH